MQITADEKKRLNSTIAELRSDRQPFWTLWREIADYFLPKRYVWLQSDREARVRNAKNPFILDSTGTLAARTLASGMMNGITSPSRPWFKIRLAGFEHEDDPVAVWCDEVARRMLFVMGVSNFYKSLAVLYLDLVVFGSAACLIYEDDENVIHCNNPALGEFYLGQSHRLAVDTFAREFKQSVKQLVTRFGIENCPDEIKSKYKKGGADYLHLYTVVHLIEPNLPGLSGVPASFKYRETYWLQSKNDNSCLSQRGFHELPGIFPRWETTANDSYGTSPAMDALPDVIQLQLETKRKAQGLDKMVNPPLVADIQLQHRPTAIMPGGITYVAGNNNAGVKPLYTVQLPLQDLTQDIQQVQQRIQDTFFNSLFNMISQLDTVRSATEIDARREEKLVLLGSVLENFENEALDPAIKRIFAIMQRRGMLPEMPESIRDISDFEIQYVSILSVAQSAVSAAPTERWVQFIGNIAGAVPDALLLPDWDELIRNYGTSIGVEARNMKSKDDLAAAKEEQQQQVAAQEAGATGTALADGAKTLSETDVGGGSNALQQLLAASS